MNQFQGIESGQGLLKNDYGQADALSLALKKRREKLMDTKGLQPPPELTE